MDFWRQAILLDWTLAGDITRLVENTYLARQITIETRYVFVRDGRTETRTSRHLVMTAAGIAQLYLVAEKV